MSEKTDRVIWQVTDTTGVPILGRAQAKLMNHISYPKIHPPQEQSPVSQDSLKPTDYVHSLNYKPVYSLQRLCSLWTVSRLHPKILYVCTFGAKLQDMTDRQNTVTPASVLPSGKWIDAASME